MGGLGDYTKIKFHKTLLDSGKKVINLKKLVIKPVFLFIFLLYMIIIPHNEIV